MSDWRSKDFLTVKEIQNVLGISTTASYELVKRLPHVRIGTTYRVSIQAFEKWVRDQERVNMA